MTLQTAAINHWVLPAAIPYVAIASYDFWLHENERDVPKVERLLHATIISGVATFLTLATLGRNVGAAIALGILLAAATCDELAYHGSLHIHERRLHWLGGAALTLCIGVWLWTA